jgi:carbamoyltransferase
MDSAIKWKTPYLGHEIKGDYPIDDVMTSILKGDICGIANGRAEFGPRALGNRTLSADPRGTKTKDKLNAIKQRQEFRPFAPMILEEHASDFFEMPSNITSSPYMQFVVKCKHPSDFPAIVHHDGTSRVQTVNQQQHPSLYNLLAEFYSETGCPMLVNTSLNIKGMPIVNDIVDAKMFSEKYDISVHTGATSYV